MSTTSTATESIQPTLSQVLSCLRREIAMRESVYAKDTCRLTPEAKGKELAGMREALRIVEAVGGLRDKLNKSRMLLMVASSLRCSGETHETLKERYGLEEEEVTTRQVLDLLVGDILSAMK